MSKKSSSLSRTKIRSRQNLLDAFGKVFLNKPIDKITIKDITDSAGYNRSTFYLYFRDIYELSEAYEESVLQEVAEIVGGIIESNFRLPLKDLIGLMAFAAGEHIDRIYLCSLLPGFSDRFKRILTPLFEAITGIDGTKKEYDYLISLLSALLLHNITYLHSHKDDVKIEDVVPIAQRLIVPGLEDLISELR